MSGVPAPALTAIHLLAAQQTAVQAARTTRRFECTEDGASKFWEIEVHGSQHSVRFGALGSRGQAKTKDFPSPEAARADAQKLIAAKLKKGYAETSAESPFIITTFADACARADIDASDYELGVEADDEVLFHAGDFRASGDIGLSDRPVVIHGSVVVGGRFGHNTPLLVTGSVQARDFVTYD